MVITDTLDSNLDNPLYDMQVVGHPTLDTTCSATRPTDLNENSNSYENLSPTISIPSSPTSESDQLLPSSKTSTGNSSLNVPVFNALQNRSRGTRSRITFLPRTPSPQPDRKKLPGMTEEYEPVTVPASTKDIESARSSTCDESIPMFELKSQSIDSGYENATLTPDGKLKTKTRDIKSGSYENTTENGNQLLYDYASPITRAYTIDDIEYATPEVNGVGYNRLRAGNRQFDNSTTRPVSNQYNKLDCSTGAIPKEELGGEYSGLRREGSDRNQAEQTLPDVIKSLGQKNH